MSNRKTVDERDKVWSSIDAVCNQYVILCHYQALHVLILMKLTPITSNGFHDSHGSLVLDLANIHIGGNHEIKW